MPRHFRRSSEPGVDMHTGWLVIHKKRLLRKPKKRFFRLSTSTLSYYKSQSDLLARDHVPVAKLDEVQIQQRPGAEGGRRKFILLLRFGKRTWTLEPETRDDFDGWVLAFEAVGLLHPAQARVEHELENPLGKAVVYNVSLPEACGMVVFHVSPSRITVQELKAACVLALERFLAAHDMAHNQEHEVYEPPELAASMPKRKVRRGADVVDAAKKMRQRRADKLRAESMSSIGEGDAADEHDVGEGQGEGGQGSTGVSAEADSAETTTEAEAGAAGILEAEAAAVTDEAAAVVDEAAAVVDEAAKGADEAAAAAAEGAVVAAEASVPESSCTDSSGESVGGAGESSDEEEDEGKDEVEFMPPAPLAASPPPPPPAAPTSRSSHVVLIPQGEMALSLLLGTPSPGKSATSQQSSEAAADGAGAPLSSSTSETSLRFDFGSFSSDSGSLPLGDDVLLINGPLDQADGSSSTGAGGDAGAGAAQEAGAASANEAVAAQFSWPSDLPRPVCVHLRHLTTRNLDGSASIAGKSPLLAMREIVALRPERMVLRSTVGDMYLDKELLTLDRYDIRKGADGAVGLRISRKDMMPLLHAFIPHTARATNPITGKQFTQYCITVRFDAVEWTIRRRYNDFRALHDKLLKSSAGAELPKLPAGKVIRSSTAQFVSRRRDQLERYLRAVLATPSYQANVDLLAWLGVVSTVQHTVDQEQHRGVLHLTMIDEYVDTGDIVLFRCRSVLSKMQRRVTRSEFDHIGIVVRRNERWYLLEATGDGVLCTPLQNRLKSYGNEYTEVMAIRKLETERSEARESSLRLFMSMVEGKPYKLNIRKVLTRRSDPSKAKHDEEKDGMVDVMSDSDDEERDKYGGIEERGSNHSDFFCSELVAAALQAFGVLPAAPAASYWPVDFASGGRVDTELEGAKFGPELVVNCQIMEVRKASKVVDFSGMRPKSTPGTLLRGQSL